MKRLCLFLVALLLPDSASLDSFYIGITYQDGSYYHEYMNAPYLELVVRDFVKHSYIESIFITRDL